MISMAEKMYIKQLHEEGVSKSEIQKRTKLNYRTVCKYADKEDWNEEKLPNVDPERYPVLGEYIPIIDEWLEADSKMPRKQRHTAQRIFDRLKDEKGFAGSYSSVKRYVRKKRTVMRQSSAGCLPLEQPQEYAQMDFGEFQYIDPEGAEKKAYELVMSFSGWNTVLGDNRLTAALIDRLVHHSHIVIFSGESYRLQQSMKRQKSAAKK